MFQWAGNLQRRLTDFIRNCELYCSSKLGWTPNVTVFYCFPVTSTDESGNLMTWLNNTYECKLLSSTKSSIRTRVGEHNRCCRLRQPEQPEMCIRDRCTLRRMSKVHYTHTRLPTRANPLRSSLVSGSVVSSWSAWKWSSHRRFSSLPIRSITRWM